MRKDLRTRLVLVTGRLSVQHGQKEEAQPRLVGGAARPFPELGAEAPSRGVAPSPLTGTVGNSLNIFAHAQREAYMCLKSLIFALVFFAACSDPENSERETPPALEVETEVNVGAAEESSNASIEGGRALDAAPLNRREEGEADGDSPREIEDALDNDALVEGNEDLTPGPSVDLDVEGAIQEDLSPEPGDASPSDETSSDDSGVVVVGDSSSGPIFGPTDSGSTEPEDTSEPLGDGGELSDDTSALDATDEEEDSSEPEPACEPNPCQAGEPALCEEGMARADFIPGDCTASSGSAVLCSYTPLFMDCGDAGGSCVAGLCQGSPAAPEEGDLVLTEVMRAPLPNQRPWFELYVSASESLNLAGCGLRDGSGAVHVFGAEAHIVEPGDFVLVSEEEPTSDGLPLPDITLAVGSLDLLTSDKAIVLTCMGEIVDVIDYPSATSLAPFPAEAGKAMQVSPQNYASDANDASNTWCSAEDPYSFGTYGTPGKPNPGCNADIDSCRLWYPAFVSGAPGEVVEVLATVFDEGVTDQTPGVPDPLPEFIGEIGLGPNGVNPEVSPQDFTWFSATPNFDPPASVPLLDDMYGAWMVPSGTGAFDFLARFSPDGGITWIYCDLDGSANGYQADKAGHLFVQ